MYLRRYFSEWYLHSNVWTFKECFKNKNNVVTQQSASYLPSTLSLCTPYSTEANPIGTVFTFRIFPIIYAELLCRALLEHPKSEWIFTWGVVNSWLLLRKEKKPSKQIGKTHWCSGKHILDNKHDLSLLCYSVAEFWMGKKTHRKAFLYLAQSLFCFFSLLKSSVWFLCTLWPGNKARSKRV